MAFLNETGLARFFAGLKTKFALKSDIPTIATQAEAEDGTDDDKLMTPAKVKTAIEKFSAATYFTLEALALTSGTVTLQTIANALPTNSRLIIHHANNEMSSVLPSANGQLIAQRDNDSLVTFSYFSMRTEGSTGIQYGELYFAYCLNGDTAPFRWTKTAVCTNDGHLLFPNGAEIWVG